MTLKPQSNRPLYSNRVIGTLATDGCSEEGSGQAAALPSPLLAVPTTHQRPVYQLHIIRCGSIIPVPVKGLTLLHYVKLHEKMTAVYTQKAYSIYRVQVSSVYWQIEAS